MGLAEHSLSFHNHLPLPITKAWERLSLRFGREMLHRALRCGVDVLCLNQWATTPRPFFFFEHLRDRGLGADYEVLDHGTFVEIRSSEGRLLLVKGLEIGVVTGAGEIGEIILLGVHEDFPVTLGELPGYVASSAQKVRLWHSVRATIEAQQVWLSVAPHPCFVDGFGIPVTLRLVEEGLVDTVEVYNAQLERFHRTQNEQAQELEERIGKSRPAFRGIIGNDGLDARSAVRSLTRVTLDAPETEPRPLLAALARKIRAGEVLPQPRRPLWSSVVWKFLHSRRKWARLRGRLWPLWHRVLSIR